MNTRIGTVVTDDGSSAQAGAMPVVLVIETRDDGIFLFRYVKDGVLAGDTWHLSVDDAKLQADFEFGDKVGRWSIVPESTEREVEYLLETQNRVPTDVELT